MTENTRCAHCEKPISVLLEKDERENLSVTGFLYTMQREAEYPKRVKWNTGNYDLYSFSDVCSRTCEQILRNNKKSQKSYFGTYQ